MTVTKRSANAVHPIQRHIHGRSTRENPQNPAEVSRWGPRHVELSLLHAQASWPSLRLAKHSDPGE